MGFWYNTQMPSKYILSRLAHKPFREPPASKTHLRQEFIDELDVRRQSVALSHAQEAKIRFNKGDDYSFDHSEVGYENEVLWEHALVPALPHLPTSLTSAMNVPYLPFFFEHSSAKALLDRAPSNAHSWILANGLFGKDFASRKSNLDADNTVIQGLSRLVADVNPPDVKAFLAWDMIHRKDDVLAAAKIVQIHVPHVHGLLKDLGMLQMDSMRQALLTEWHKPSRTMVTLELPSDLSMDSNI